MVTIGISRPREGFFEVLRTFVNVVEVAFVVFFGIGDEVE